MWPRHFLLEEADDGDRGGAGTEGAGDGIGEEIKALPGQVKVLTDALTLMVKGQAEMQNQLKELAQTRSAPAQNEEQPKPKDNADLFEGIDLEQIDRKQFGTILLSKFMERIEEHMGTAIKPVMEKIGQIEHTVTNDLGSRQISDVLKDNKDLYEWKDEIAGLLKETPNMKLSRALTIARSENPEKAKAMQKKYTVPGDDGTKRPVTLSLTPTSRVTGGDEKVGRMKFNEAAERAFDDVLSSLGATDLNQVMPHR